jgi:ureidoglycolate lyase
VIELAIEPLSKDAFRPFGDVIEAAGAQVRLINEGTTRRFHDLARIAVTERGGYPIVSLFEARRRELPIRVRMLERHPLGSQAFYPLSLDDWLVVVGEGAQTLDPGSIRAFRARGDQGVNYAPDVWHHPVLALAPLQMFLVVDRGGPGDNLDECWLPEHQHRLIAPSDPAATTSRRRA